MHKGIEREKALQELLDGGDFYFLEILSTKTMEEISEIIGREQKELRRLHSLGKQTNDVRDRINMCYAVIEMRNISELRKQEELEKSKIGGVSIT